MTVRRTWLLKTEPSEYSFADLESDGATTWDGVTSALALQHLREIRTGDAIVIYHTGSERAAVGLARTTRGAYSDPDSPEARIVVVDLEPVRRFDRPATLAQIKTMPEFADSPLVRIGRLSVVPITAAQWKAIETLQR